MACSKTAGSTHESVSLTKLLLLISKINTPSMYLDFTFQESTGIRHQS